MSSPSRVDALAVGTALSSGLPTTRLATAPQQEVLLLTDEVFEAMTAARKLPVVAERAAESAAVQAGANEAAVQTAAATAGSSSLPVATRDAAASAPAAPTATAAVIASGMQDAPAAAGAQSATGGAPAPASAAGPGPVAPTRFDLDFRAAVDVADVSAAAARPGSEVQPYNGSGGTTAGVGASGNQQIDGILSGIRWAGSFITYSDPDSSADYQAGYYSDGNGNFISAQFEGFGQISAGQVLSVHFALNAFLYTQPAGSLGFSVEGFTNLGIDFSGPGTGTGTIRVANSSDPPTSYAYYPNNGIYGGDVWMGTSARNPVAGNYDWYTTIHELGHALGLKHGQETNVFGALPSNVDSTEFSVMTYRSFIGHNLSTYPFTTNANDSFPQTWMMLDIQALQYMYGADYSINAGNTTYTWATTGETYVDGNLAIDPVGNKIYATIWDGGGNDTYDLSNYTTNLVLDLNPGGWSTFSSAQLANIGFYTGTDIYARGNIANALLFGGNTASLIENAFGGSGNDAIYGNQGANYLLGNSGNDYLDGSTGNDTVDGGLGADTLNGYDQDDLYYVDNTGDVIAGEFDDALGGVDTVVSSVTYTLVNAMENLTLAGFDNIDGIGNYKNNNINGNSGNNALYGLDGNDNLYAANGNDTLDGGTGADTMNGYDQDDLYIVDNAGDLIAGEFDDPLGGIDTVQSSVDYTLVNPMEHLTLTGFAFAGTGNYHANIITGNDYDNLLYGLGDNDTIYGNSGLDTIYGGDGNDSIIGGLDVDTEIYAEGGDDIIVFTYGNFFDNVDGGAGFDTLDATAAVSFSGLPIYDFAAGTISGYPGGQTVTGIELFLGSVQNETVVSNGLSNSYYGNGGDDYMIAGLGDETMDGGAGGTDTIDLTLWDGPYTLDMNTGLPVEWPGELYTNFENLISGNGNDSITGTADANSISTTGGNDTIVAGAGNDTLNGGTGDDSMVGGADSDTYYVDSAGDAVRELLNAGTDTVYTGLATYILSQHVDNLVLTSAASQSGAGNYLANVITATTAAGHKLEGLSGLDTLFGNTGNDTLLGGGDTDSMVGGLGDDKYQVDLASDVIVELLGEGTDSVDSRVNFYKLSDNIENLTNGFATGSQTGQGNTLNNLLTGGTANDNLAGLEANDTLTGGAANDTLNGGVGDDSLLGGNDNDSLLGFDGNDTLLGGNGNDTLSGGNNNDSLSGEANNDSMTGGSGDDTLNGAAGNDTLNGGSGIDSQRGGEGNDDYVGVESGDIITEFGNQGYDRVFTGGSLTLAANLEYLELTSGANGTGNTLDNTLVGNSGNNTLNGLGGADILYGRAGNDNLDAGADALQDQFVFDTALNAATNVDTLLNAEFGEDQILLDNDIFAALLLGAATNEGTLGGTYYFEGAGLTGGGAADARGIWYNLSNGNLYYNPTSAVAGDSILFAAINGAPAALANTDFTLYTDAG